MQCDWYYTKSFLSFSLNLNLIRYISVVAFSFSHPVEVGWGLKEHIWTLHTFSIACFRRAERRRGETIGHASFSIDHPLKRSGLHMGLCNYSVYSTILHLWLQPEFNTVHISNMRKGCQKFTQLDKYPNITGVLNLSDLSFYSYNTTDNTCTALWLISEDIKNPHVLRLTYSYINNFGHVFHN